MTAPRPRPDVQRTNVPAADVRELPGREALVLASLLLGLIMMGIQLWLLTVALELYLSGEGEEIWGLAIGSGLVFAGGLAALWLLSQAPRMPRRDR